MALSIKTQEADRLARELASLTGETMTCAVTIALRERLARERVARGGEDLVARLTALAAEIAPKIRGGPVTQAEWDWAGGDDWDLAHSEDD